MDFPGADTSYFWMAADSRSLAETASVGRRCRVAERLFRPAWPCAGRLRRSSMGQPGAELRRGCRLRGKPSLRLLQRVLPGLEVFLSLGAGWQAQGWETSRGPGCAGAAPRGNRLPSVPTATTEPDAGMRRSRGTRDEGECKKSPQTVKKKNKPQTVRKTQIVKKIPNPNEAQRAPAAGRNSAFWENLPQYLRGEKLRVLWGFWRCQKMKASP